MKRTANQYTEPVISQALRDAGITSNGCVAVATSRALAEVFDSPQAAAEWIPIVVETLRTDSGAGLRANGSHKGGIGHAMDELGIYYRFQREHGDEYEIEGGWVDGHYRRGKVLHHWVEEHYREPSWKTAYPTVAQWLKRNPHVKRAVIGTQGHAAFVDHGKVYGASMRYRIKAAWIIEEDVEAREADWAVKSVWHDVRVSEIRRHPNLRLTQAAPQEPSTNRVSSLITDRMKDADQRTYRARYVAPDGTWRSVETLVVIVGETEARGLGLRLNDDGTYVIVFTF